MFSEPTLPVLIKAWKEFILSGQKLEIIPDPPELIEVKQPNWNGLQDSLLSGKLYFIYSRVRMNCFVSGQVSNEVIAYANNISTALGLITDGILTVRIETAVADAINILQQVGYIFTEDEKIAWNQAVEELGFSDLIKL
jgi:hypothetical protein